MGQKLAKKLRKHYKLTAKDSIEAFKLMIRGLTFKKRVILARKILWNSV